MNKFILSIMMILTTAGCFAELPNMKDYNGRRDKDIFNRFNKDLIPQLNG